MAAFFMALFFVRLQTYIKKNINRKPAKIPLAGYLRRVGLGIPRQICLTGKTRPAQPRIARQILFGGETPAR